jgi:hypothetical protein
MVKRHYQSVAVRSEAQKLNPHQRSALKIERIGLFLER